MPLHNLLCAASIGRHPLFVGFIVKFSESSKSCHGGKSDVEQYNFSLYLSMLLCFEEGTERTKS